MSLWTFKDQVQALRDFLENKLGNAEGRRIRRAIYDAHRDLAGRRRWNYFTTFYDFSLNAAYETGTIAYDHTGGANERMVTLTTGTWPTWAALGYLVISGIPYKVASRVSSSIITLSVHSNPGADVAAGTAYTLYQDSYKLPELFVSLESVMVLSNKQRLQEISARELAINERIFITPGLPAKFTLMQDPNYQGRNALRISPPPSAAESLEVLYHRAPKAPTLEDYSTGTVSTSADSATVTGSGTAWDSTHVGACLRISSSATEAPDGPDGDNPAIVERVVLSVESTTSLTVDATIPTTYSGKAYRLSSIIDIDQQTMLNAFQRGCESMLMLTSVNRERYAAAYADEILRAQEMDNKVVERVIIGDRAGSSYEYPAPYETGP